MLARTVKLTSISTISFALKDSFVLFISLNHKFTSFKQQFKVKLRKHPTFKQPLRFRLAVWILLVFSKTFCSNASETILSFFRFPHGVIFSRSYLIFWRCFDSEMLHLFLVLSDPKNYELEDFAVTFKTIF